MSVIIFVLLCLAYASHARRILTTTEELVSNEFTGAQPLKATSTLALLRLIAPEFNPHMAWAAYRHALNKHDGDLGTSNPSRLISRNSLKTKAHVHSKPTLTRDHDWPTSAHLLRRSHGTSLMTSTSSIAKDDDVSNERAASNENPELFIWASSKGAYIAEEVGLQEGTSELPRGLIAKDDIPAGSVLITLPSSLQLGVNACQNDTGMCALIDTVTPSLWSARLGLALWAEKRQGSASSWADYIAELPNELSACLAPGYGSNEASAALEAWPPTGERAIHMRQTLRSLHAQLERTAGKLQISPPSFDELSWATAITGSRGYRVRGDSNDRYGGTDAASLLPVIDLVNHAPTLYANAELRNAPNSTQGGLGASDDPFAVSLYASRSIKAGEEVLADYGFGTDLSNERLLLTYGFILEDNPNDTLSLPFGAIGVGLEAVGSSESSVSAREVEELGARQMRLLAELGDVQTAGLVFRADGYPTEETLALTLVVTSQRLEELQYANVEKLVAWSRSEGLASSDAHMSRARKALYAIVAQALQQVQALSYSVPAVGSSFEAAALAYCKTRYAILERACKAMG